MQFAAYGQLSLFLNSNSIIIIDIDPMVIILRIQIWTQLCILRGSRDGLFQSRDRDPGWAKPDPGCDDLDPGCDDPDEKVCKIGVGYGSATQPGNELSN